MAQSAAPAADLHREDYEMNDDQENAAPGLGEHEAAVHAGPGMVDQGAEAGPPGDAAAAHGLHAAGAMQPEVYMELSEESEEEAEAEAEEEESEEGEEEQEPQQQGGMHNQDPAPNALGRGYHPYHRRREQLRAWRGPGPVPLAEDDDIDPPAAGPHRGRAAQGNADGAAAAAAAAAWMHRGEGAGPGPGSQALEQEDVEVFTDDDTVDESQDTTADQLKAGKDIQGIPWDRLQFSREQYRNLRLRSYRNYTNVLPEDAAEYRGEILGLANPAAPSRHGRFFDFVRNSRTVQSTIVHFQLRNLVWAVSRNDVFVVQDNCVHHWNPATREVLPVLDMSGSHNSRRMPGVGAVQVSTMCIRDGLLALGGFHGELVCVRLADLSAVFSGRVTRSDNGITNGIEICSMRGHGPCVLAANNDFILRLFTADTFQLTSQVTFPWAVNYAVVRPDSTVAAVVGDNEVAQLTDLAAGGRLVAKLEAHKDYSFAAAWHPNGNMLATGNQDTTAAVWDMRNLSKPVARLVGRMGAIRSLRFSPDGRFLAVAEPADFVHVYDVKAGFKQVQEVDLFGEIAGISFTPHSDAFFVGVADLTYSSLLEFDRHHDSDSDCAGRKLGARALLGSTRDL